MVFSQGFLSVEVRTRQILPDTCITPAAACAEAAAVVMGKEQGETRWHAAKTTRVVWNNDEKHRLKTKKREKPLVYSRLELKLNQCRTTNSAFAKC